MTDFPYRSRCAVYDAPIVRRALTQADILRNNYRIAERTLTQAEERHAKARRQIGYANAARINRDLRKSDAMREMNQARATLRQAQAACLVATYALSTVPGALDAFVEQAAFIVDEQARIVSLKARIANAIIAAAEAGQRGVQIGRDWYAAFNARHARAWLADPSYIHFRV